MVDEAHRLSRDRAELNELVLEYAVYAVHLKMVPPSHPEAVRLTIEEKSPGVIPTNPEEVDTLLDEADVQDVIDFLQEFRKRSREGRQGDGKEGKP